MKKTIILCWVICCSTIVAKACDICGCGVGSGYIGILPDFNKKIFGLRYRTNSLKTHVGIGGSSSYLTTTEHYQVSELWGAINITRKIRLMATIPYNFNEKENSSGIHNINGLGDISLAGFYNLMNTRTAAGDDRLIVQSLWLGAGVKLPSGKYAPANKLNSNDANIFQLGTGSFDFNVLTMYDLRLQDMGINLTGSYKMNTVNKDDYAYGNKLSVNAQFYHKFKLGNYCSVAPNAGATFEKSKKDREDNFTMDVSGGNITMATIGSEISYKKIVAGFNWQTPLGQNLANGLVKANNKAMLHIAFAL